MASSSDPRWVADLPHRDEILQCLTVLLPVLLRSRVASATLWWLVMPSRYSAGEPNWSDSTLRSVQANVARLSDAIISTSWSAGTAATGTAASQTGTAAQLEWALQFVRLVRLVTALPAVLLVQLAGSVPNGTSPRAPEDVMVHICTNFQNWKDERLVELHDQLAKTPLQRDRELLIRCCPYIQIEALPILVEILKIPVPDLLAFAEIARRATPSDVLLLARLTQVNLMSLLQLKDAVAREATPMDRLPVQTLAEAEAAAAAVAASSDGADGSGDQADSSSSANRTGVISQALAFSTSGLRAEDEQQFRLQIVRYPEPLAVSSKFLLPTPTVRVSGPDITSGRYYVQVCLVRSGTMEILPMLEGSLLQEVRGYMAVFPRLRIAGTSFKSQSLFRLSFSLMHAKSSSGYEAIPGAVALGNEIEVFSHVRFILNPTKGHAPVVRNLVPGRGKISGAIRVAILGSNFVNSSEIYVHFGALRVPALFHDSCVLICMLPAAREPGVVNVKVQLGSALITSPVQFEYI